MPCRTCQHRKWIIKKVAAAHWTICVCTLKKWNYGVESDLPLRKEDKARNVVPMPVKCRDYKDWRIE